jgi:hypothetical protein
MVEICSCSGFKQRGHVGLDAGRIETGPTLQRGGIDHGKVELLVSGAELVEQVKGLIDDPARARSRAVDLVHHHDCLVAERQGFTRDETGLRHRTLDRVD